MSGKKEGKKARSGGNPRGLGNGNGSLREQLEALRDSDPEFEKLFGTSRDFSVDGEGNFTGCPKELQRQFKHRPSYWYKDNAENKVSANTFAKGSSSHHHRQRESVKERKMEQAESSTGGDTIFRAAAEHIANKEGNRTKVDAAEEALRQGYEMGRKAAHTDTAKEAVKEEAKGFWDKTKKNLSDKKTAIGIMLGVAGCVAATAGVKAYKERQGQRTMRVGDSTVVFGTAGAGEGGGGQGGNQGGGAPMGNDNARGNRGGGR